jgi:B-cell receptor-associated protein 31
LILSRTYSLVSELIDTQTQLELVKKGGAGTGAGGADVGEYLEGQGSEPPLTDHFVFTAAMKKQMEQQQVEYQRLADELAAAKGEAPSSKKD